MVNGMTNLSKQNFHQMRTCKFLWNFKLNDSNTQNDITQILYFGYSVLNLAHDEIQANRIETTSAFLIINSYISYFIHFLHIFYNF